MDRDPVRWPANVGIPRVGVMSRAYWASQSCTEERQDPKGPVVTSAIVARVAEIAEPRAELRQARAAVDALKIQRAQLLVECR